ncbi:MAG: MFS transporter [Acetobacteraceae bacterium]|jgi:MFS family permease
MPIWPLLATLAVQTLATMALYSMPTLAPEVARDLKVNGALVGGFVATAYGTGIVSALLSPGLIRRHGGVRATQAVLLAAAGMLAIAASSFGISGLACAAIVLGSGYGAAAPASTHLLVPHTPRAMFNLVMSLRQIGVPLGGVFAALLLPPLVPILGWRGSLLAELVPVFLLIASMEVPRRKWDADHDPSVRPWGRTLLQPFLLLRDRRLLRLSLSCFIYSGLQLSFVAFMTVHLTTVVGFDLIRAGQMLAIYQIAGSVSRPVWGWIADRYLTPIRTLGVLGVGMAVAAALAGQFGSDWSTGEISAVVLLAGCTAGGYTGVAYAEYASLGGTRRTEATGLGTALMFSGGLLIPPSFGASVTFLGGFGETYRTVAVLALASAILMWWRPARD